MCLEACKIRTEKFQAKTGKVTVYKAYQRTKGDKTISSPYYSDVKKGGQITEPGEIISSRPHKAVAWKKNQITHCDKQNNNYHYGGGATISKGIHVYLKRVDAIQEAEYNCNGFGVVVPLEADYNDLIGVAPLDEGCNSFGMGEGSHAVFMKVRLTDAVWAKLFPQTKEEKAAKQKARRKKAKRAAKRKVK